MSILAPACAIPVSLYPPPARMCTVGTGSTLCLNVSQCVSMCLNVSEGEERLDASGNV